MVRLTDARGMLALELHESVFRGLQTEAGLSATVTLTDAARLDQYADDLDNSTGQRADLARAIAGLVRVAGTLTAKTRSQARGGFWEVMAT